MAGKVKTRDRILQTSLALFNNEGEAQVSTVDIAAVLGISPGNLYYHFRGKEAIIDALFDDFETELRMVLSAPIEKPLDIEDNWVFIYIIFEEINDFRFFYKGMASILERCPDLRPRFARLLALKRETTLALMANMEMAGFAEFGEHEKETLAERLVMQMTFWLPYKQLADQSASDRALINDGVFALLLQLAPYVTGDRALFIEMLDDFFKKQKR